MGIGPTGDDQYPRFVDSGANSHFGLVADGVLVQRCVLNPDRRSAVALDGASSDTMSGINLCRRLSAVENWLQRYG